jgi:hypothetical protein
MFLQCAAGTVLGLSRSGTDHRLHHSQVNKSKVKQETVTGTEYCDPQFGLLSHQDYMEQLTYQLNYTHSGHPGINSLDNNTGISILS